MEGSTWQRLDTIANDILADVGKRRASGRTTRQGWQADSRVVGEDRTAPRERATVAKTNGNPGDGENRRAGQDDGGRAHVRAS